MRLLFLSLLLAASGCSTAPCAGFLDWVAPGKARPNEAPLPPAGQLGEPAPIAAPSSPVPPAPAPVPAPAPPPKPKAVAPPLEPIPTSSASPAITTPPTAQSAQVVEPVLQPGR